MSYALLNTVLRTLSAGGTAVKGALGLAVAVAAIGTAGAAGAVSLVSNQTGVEPLVQDEVPTGDAPDGGTAAEESDEEAGGPVEEDVEKADEEATPDADGTEDLAEDQPAEDETTKDGPPAGTFGAVVHEIKNGGGSGQEVPAAAHQKNEHRKAARAAEGEGAGAPEGEGAGAPEGEGKLKGPGESKGAGTPKGAGKPAGAGKHEQVTPAPEPAAEETAEEPTAKGPAAEGPAAAP